VGKGYSELNDPLDQAERFAAQEDMRKAGDQEAQMYDRDFVEALEYGMPPTTGIGPGIERMAMIFTEQENIDDVIFFPLMRPAISAINSALYGIQPTELAPVEDLVMTVEEFESLCAEGVLKPQTTHITIKPHVRIWNATPGKSRASGHVDIEGFVPNGVLRVAGYKIGPEHAHSEPDRKKKEEALTELPLVRFLQRTFPNCKTTVSPPTALHNEP